MDSYHIVRRNGKYDLICTRCFVTLLSTKDPYHIRESQTVHPCSPLIDRHHEMRKSEMHVVKSPAWSIQKMPFRSNVFLSPFW